MAEPAFVGRRSIVGALQATGGVLRTTDAARGPLGVPSGSEVVTGRAGCLNWARPDLWEGRRASAAPTRRPRSFFDAACWTTGTGCRQSGAPRLGEAIMKTGCRLLAAILSWHYVVVG